MNASATALTVNPGQLVYPESPRWRDGRLWFSDVHAYAIKTVDLQGRVAVVAEVPGRPAGIGFLPDGRLLVASALDRRLWTWDGSDLRLAADLGDVALGLLNDMVVDGRGRAYISDTGFNLMAGDPPRIGQIILYQDSAPGTTRVRIVSTDVMFPNGAAVSQDGSHYWVAETAANRVSMFDIDADGSLSTRHTLIDLPDMCDGLCLDVDRRHLGSATTPRGVLASPARRICRGDPVRGRPLSSRVHARWRRPGDAVPVLRRDHDGRARPWSEHRPHPYDSSDLRRRLAMRTHNRAPTPATRRSSSLDTVTTVDGGNRSRVGTTTSGPDSEAWTIRCTGQGGRFQRRRRQEVRW